MRNLFVVVLFWVTCFTTLLFAADALKPVYTVDETKAFKTLANETIQAIDANDAKTMVEKITDLETAWDEKEAVLKPKDPATWTSIDKTLDKAISAIRSSKKDYPKGKAALQLLVTKLDQATKP